MRRKNNSEIGFTVSEAPLMDNEHKEQEGHFIMPNNASWRNCNEDFDEIQDTAKTCSESVGKVQNLLNKEPEETFLLVERHERMLGGIDDSISSILIRMVKDRYGQLCWPWQLKDGF